MQQTLWNTHQIKCCEKEIGQELLKDEHSLISFQQDFGRLTKAQPAAVFIPNNLLPLEQLVQYANQFSLPINIRGNGLSQSGQSLAVDGGVTVHLKNFRNVYSHAQDSIWVDGNASWASLLETSLTHSQIPYVLPYNCNLSVAGVLSVGGVGASSFRFGTVSSYVKALEVLTANGKRQIVDAQSELFQACLSGQGRFGIITKACIQLRSCARKVRTFFLVYSDKEQWLNDVEEARREADYLETFCSPSVQGSKLKEGKRQPFAQWLYALHIAKEFDYTPPAIEDFSPLLKPLNILHVQDENIESYLHRHDSRFEMMRLLGQWEMIHPWYECFIPRKLLAQHLESLLTKLPLHYVPVLQIVPMAPKAPTGFFMMPEDDTDVYAIMILHPGVHPKLLDSSVESIQFMDDLFLQQGGKRYLSGYLGPIVKEQYWQKHFGPRYKDWMGLKKQFDPKNVFRSQLHRR
ncbi:FAD-binding protein [Legionella jordanis]|uniref:Cytokinin oxidase n=1 Tax=Legionella jordanis TaxID=456 RepID=A0A0W0V8V6_9GAMM|nr:FAD-binding protein [Legionella jordanis]KTD16301.1 cytokinin oxidase [Legionella jordanis]RMX04485.1 FAD-binding protein [Legionella jordanis]VEH12241.1 cytokinin oxidase [Legionella jordanis]HAT8713451.1 FAD-binding protein [Legionella jordanis]